MSAYSGPEFDESGVVFYYDMNNAKSYAGAPATNLVPNASTMPDWSTYGGSPVAFQTEFGTTGVRLTNAPSWNGVFRGVTVPSTGTYTFSAWIRYLGGSPNNNGGGVYISGWGGSDIVTTVDKNIIGQWQRVSRTITVTTTTMTFFIISYGGNSNGSSDHSSWEITMPQLEAGSVATTFVNGTRSGTQVVRDLVGSNTLTASSLTYNTNNTFTFNGSSNFINLDTNIQAGYTSASYEFWCRPTALPGSGNYFQLYIQEASTWIALYNLGAGAFFGIDLHNGAGWFDGNGGSVTGARTTTPLTANTDYYVAYSWNGSTVSVYLNGNLQATVSTLQAANGRPNVTQLSAGGTPRNIGSRGNGAANNWVGTINSVKFYNRALSAAEVFSNFTASRLRYGI